MTSRCELIAELERYKPFCASDGAARDEILTFVRREPGAAERGTSEGHLTGSAWAVAGTGESAEIILLHHRKLGRWLQPGGHADGSWDLAAVALSEAIEESGIEELTLEDRILFDCDRHRIPQRGHELAHWHYDLRYVVRAPLAIKPRGNRESNEIRWVALPELERYTLEESVLRMRAKWLMGGARISIR